MLSWKGNSAHAKLDKNSALAIVGYEPEQMSAFLEHVILRGAVASRDGVHVGRRHLTVSRGSSAQRMFRYFVVCDTDICRLYLTERLDEFIGGICGDIALYVGSSIVFC